MTAEAQILLNRTKKNLRRIGPWAKREGISCFRIYDRDIPELPLSIDLYENCLYVAVYDKRSTSGLMNSVGEVIGPVADDLGIDMSRVFTKKRERQRGGSQYEKIGVGGSEFVVAEGGYKFIVNLSDYLDTGLFLDHRRTRKIVGDESSSKHVLNLFAYTGAFTVYAAGGGASSTTTVDLSNTYLDWAMKNLRMNGLLSSKHRFIRDDVLRFLDSHHPPTDGYDMVIVDAPTVSRSKSMQAKFEIQKDHVHVLNRTLSYCRSGAAVYFATNFRKFKLFEKEIEGARIEEISSSTVPFDFRDKNVHRCFRLEKR